MLHKTCLGFLLVLFILGECGGVTNPCDHDPTVVTTIIDACVSDLSIKRQLFIPITNHIGTGCQCKVTLLSRSGIAFKSRLETTFRNVANTSDSCGFRVSTEFDGDLQTLQCNETKTISEEINSDNEVIYRFTGSSIENSTTICLQIFPKVDFLPDDSGINIQCSNQIDSPMTRTHESTTESTSSPSSVTSNITRTSLGVSESSPVTAELTVAQSDSSNTSFSETTKPSTIKPSSTSAKQPSMGNREEDHISFIIILIGSCVGGFCIIMLIVMVTCCIIYRNKRRREESKEMLPENDLNGHSLEGVQIENELFIMAFKNEGYGGVEGQNNANDSFASIEDNEPKLTPIMDTGNDTGAADNELPDSQSIYQTQLPDKVEPSAPVERKVNFNIPIDVDETLSEQSVTDFNTNPTITQPSVEEMRGHIQL